MNSAVQKYLEAATGVTNLTRARAEKVVRQLVKQGEAASDQVGDLVEELLDKQKKNREMVQEMVKAETKRAIRAMGLATTTEVERLQKQVADLKREVSKATGSGGRKLQASKGNKADVPPAKKTAKKTTAKKSGSKRSSEESA